MSETWRRRWVWLAWAGLGVVLAGVVTAFIRYGLDPSSTPAAGTGSVSASHTVVYQAEGGGARGARSGSITLQSADGGTQQAQVGLPLRTKSGDVGLTYPGFHSGAFVYLSVQNGDDAGTVTCRILVDGVTISENTSSGGHTIATCSSRVP